MKQLRNPNQYTYITLLLLTICLIVTYFIEPRQTQVMQAGKIIPASPENVELLRLNFEKSKQQLQRLTPSIWPTTSKVVTSPFGYRKDPFTFSPSFHAGMDISAPENDPVYASADGTVVSTGSDKARGNNIVIEHSRGLRTWYMHLNKVLVHDGDTVQKGDTIGLLGSTGRSTGPHLHYEVIDNGVSVDPRLFLPND